MERDEIPIRQEIEECVNGLRADIQALEDSGAADQSIVEELRRVIEEIQACLRAVPDRSIGATPKLTD